MNSLLKKCGLELLFLLLLSMVAGASPLCNDSLKANLQIENARPYNDIGTALDFNAYYKAPNGSVINTSSTNVAIDLNNVSYNMTFDGTKWSIQLISNVSEDDNIVVNATDDQFRCQVVGFTTRWRTPFFVNIDLYKQPFNQSGQLADPARYGQEFQYVVLVNNNGKNSDDMTLWAINRGTDNLYNTLFGWALDTNSAKLNTDVPDRNTYFWGTYNTGEATIKLYEGGNYSVYVMSNKIEYPSGYFWEFERPSVNDEVSYMGNVINRLAIYNATNPADTANTYNQTTYKIFMTKFEANTYYAIMNIGIIAIAVVLFIAGLVMIIQLFGNSPAMGQIMLYYILIGGAIVVSVVFYVQ